MRDNIRNVISQATELLTEWADGHHKLCDFKREIYDGWYYTTIEGQAWYIFKYYPAYFAEYLLMLRALKNVTANPPHILSLGCGCLVDAAAACEVFDDFTYTGYDVNNWSIKAVHDKRCVFQHKDISVVTEFDPEINVIVFPRSIGDLKKYFNNIAQSITASNFSHKEIWICSSLRVGDQGITSDISSLSEFLKFLDGYTISSDGILYKPANDPDVANKVISQMLSGWLHPDSRFGEHLLQQCKGYYRCDDNCEAQIKPSPMMKMYNISYAIAHAVRR